MTTFKDLQLELDRLKREHSFVGLKSGTEVEAMNYEEITFMRKLCRDIMPITAKIGGPEARTDIEAMLRIGIDNILAPMIESPYALANFVKAARSLLGERTVKLSINLETITGFEQLKRIVEHQAFKEIHQITVGRSDLAASMEQDVDADNVLEVTAEIVTLARLKGKRSSVGGKVSRANALLLQNRVGSDYINTRHVVLKRGSREIEQAVEQALIWEHSLYSLLEGEFPARAPFYAERRASIKSRLKAVTVKR